MCGKKTYTTQAPNKTKLTILRAKTGDKVVKIRIITLNKWVLKNKIIQ